VPEPKRDSETVPPPGEGVRDEPGFWEPGGPSEDDQGLAPAVEILAGSVGDAIADRASREDTLLIVMAPFGARPAAGRWLGRVAAEVVARTVKPILFVPPGPAPGPTASTGPFLSGPVRPIRLQHVLIPLDGSAEAERAVDQSRSIVSGLDPTYTLVRVVTGERNDIVGDSARAHDYLGALGDRLRMEGLEVAEEVVHDRNPANGILRAAVWVGADLIAMTDHGRNACAAQERGATNGHPPLGTVTDHVLRSGGLPTLLCRPGNRPIPELEPE